MSIRNIFHLPSSKQNVPIKPKVPSGGTTPASFLSGLGGLFGGIVRPKTPASGPTSTTNRWNGSITVPWTPQRCKDIAAVTGIVIRPTDGGGLATDDMMWNIFLRDNGLTAQWQDTNSKTQIGTLRINRPTTGAYATDDMMWNIFLNSNGLKGQWQAQGSH